MLCAALAIASGCSGTKAETPGDSSTAAAAAPSAAAPATQVQTLQLTYDKPAVVGGNVRATASGLPAGKTAELLWGTAEGGWVVEDYYHFRGKKYEQGQPSHASGCRWRQLAVARSDHDDGDVVEQSKYGDVQHKRCCRRKAVVDFASDLPRCKEQEAPAWRIAREVHGLAHGLIRARPVDHA